MHGFNNTEQYSQSQHLLIDSHPYAACSVCVSLCMCDGTRLLDIRVVNTTPISITSLERQLLSKSHKFVLLIIIL